MNTWPTTEHVRAKYARGMRSDGTPAIFEKWRNEFDLWLADHDAKVRAEALREARDEINRTRNAASLITLADKFGGYHQGQRSGLEMAEGAVCRIEQEVSS